MDNQTRSTYLKLNLRRGKNLFIEGEEFSRRLEGPLRSPVPVTPNRWHYQKFFLNNGLEKMCHVNERIIKLMTSVLNSDQVANYPKTSDSLDHRS